MYVLLEPIRSSCGTNANLPKWILQVEDTNEHKVLVASHDNATHVPWAWGFSGERPSADVPLVLTANKDKQVVWHLQLCDNSIPNAYT